MSHLLCIIFFNLIFLRTLEAYKALVIFPLPSKSHSIIGDSIVQLIADAGNEVTYLTSFPRQKPSARIREITIFNDSHKKMWTDGLNFKAVLDGKSRIYNFKGFLTLLNELSSEMLQQRNVQILMNDPNEKFDVIIVEWLYNDVYAGLTPIFDCPLIWLSSTEPHWKLLRLIDDIPNPAYNPDFTYSYQPPFSFLQRVQQLGFQIQGLLQDYFFTSTLLNSQYDNIIANSIRKRGRRVPNFEELRFNASLVLSNTHISLGSATKLPMNYKVIAGYHIPKNTEPLTGELQIIMDNAKYGVIYFSLGSNLKSHSLPDGLKNSLLKMFGGLNQTVLWKFEDDIPNTPSNVHIVHWAPQKSILAHKNCILFITHGGFLSMIEAIHFGIPLIGIPVFGDQFGNVARSVQRGFAQKVDLSYTMADNIQVAVQEIVANSSYAARAKEISAIYFDRPASPAAELVHWVKHVVQTRGALHLRSPALLIHWYQKVYLDLAVVILIVIFGLQLIIKRICFRLYMKEERNKKNKRK